MTLNPKAEDKGSDLQEVEEALEAQDVEATLDSTEPEVSDTQDSANDAPLELIQELEYVRPPAGEKKSKKDEDDDAAELSLSSVSEARAVLEGYLFTSNEPLSVQRLCKLMNNLHPRTVRGLLLELQMEYDNRSGALQIVEIAGGFQLATRAHLSEWMFRMHRHKRRSALSPATLETLAIVAYKQPITKGEVEAIRGVESSGTVRTLQDLNMVEASGRREVIGRPQLFITTDQFLKAFGLKSLADLPSISELRQLFSNEQKLQAAVAVPQADLSEALADVPDADDDSERTDDEPALEPPPESNESSVELSEETTGDLSEENSSA